jgi:hypothetical protein
MKRKELWHVIDADLETLFSVWNQTGPCFVEASNETITFGKYVRKLDTASESKSNYAFDFEAGFQFSQSLIESVYVRMSSDQNSIPPTIEIDFSGLPHGMRIVELPTGTGNSQNSFHNLSSLLSDQTVSREQMEFRRKLIRDERPMCPCCEKSSKLRVEYAALHPLFDIFLYASHEKRRLRFEVVDNAVEMGGAFVIEEAFVSDGRVLISGEGGLYHCRVNMRWVHALVIHERTTDGFSYANLGVFDSHGVERFRISSEIPEDGIRWANMCEDAKRYF